MKYIFYCKKSQLSHNFVKMAYFYKIMCVKKSAFKKVILSDFFKNTSLSCFVQPSGERQTHFAFFSPLSPSLFPFVQSNSFVMRQFLFPYICACVHSGKKRPHSLAAYCSLLAHTLTIPCERPQGDCPAVHSHIHCALGGNRLAWQPNISLFSMILWDSGGKNGQKAEKYENIKK